ncbi:MAG: thiamine diphosphokinase [Lachnospiraceae bacterium]|nr:thiamine diphosphokinase [Lachnospiraceae bacterium]
MILIFCGGKYNLDFCREYLNNKEFDTIICTDSGLNTCHALKRIPDIIIGDFDSVDMDILKEYKNKNIPIEKYPVEKDETDLELAIVKAVELSTENNDNNDTDVVILGATGGRMDHLLANIDLLYYALCSGVRAEIIDSYSRLYFIKESTRIYKENLYGKYISLVPYAGNVKGLTLKGFKYETVDYTLEKGRSRGISNECCEDSSVMDISFDEGVLMVVESNG